MNRRWYVYHLIDPRDGNPFYVGKGCGTRISDHETEARREQKLGLVDTSKKCNRIREIWSAGLFIERRLFQSFDTEQGAIAAEVSEIRRFGSLLTNVVHGYRPKPIKWDASMIRFMAGITRMSEGFKGELRFSYGDEASPHVKAYAEGANELGFVKSVNLMLREAVERHGLNWVNRQFKSHGITFNCEA